MTHSSSGDSPRRRPNRVFRLLRASPLWRTVLAVASSVVSLLGCERPPPTFQALLDGEVEVAAAEREGLANLAQVLGVDPSELYVSDSSYDLTKDGRAGGAVISDGHVIQIHLSQEEPTEISDPGVFDPFLRLRRLEIDNPMPDLEGFGPLPELVKLYGLVHTARGFEALAGSPKLRRLSLEDSPIEDLEALPPLPALEGLNIRVTGSESPVGLRSLAGIGDFPSLDTLRLSRPEVEDLSPLARLPNLRRLYVSSGSLTSLSTLPVLEALEELSMVGGELRTLERMPSLPNLTSLSLRSNELRDLEGIPRLPKLEKLNVEGNPLESLEALAPEAAPGEGPSPRPEASDHPLLPALADLDISNTEVSDLSPIRHLPALERVDLQLTSVERLPVIGYTGADRVHYEIKGKKGYELYLDYYRRFFGGQGYAESLPSLTGSMDGVRGSLRSRKVGNRIEVSGTRTIEEVRGAVAMTVKDDMEFGETRPLNLSGEASVESGTLRIHTYVDVDFGMLAEMDTDYRPDREPGIRVGDPRDPGTYVTGYSYDEIRPGEPVSFGGEAVTRGTSWQIVLEAVDGPVKGVRLEFEP